MTHTRLNIVPDKDNVQKETPLSWFYVQNCMFMLEGRTKLYQHVYQLYITYVYNSE